LRAKEETEKIILVDKALQGQTDKMEEDKDNSKEMNSLQEILAAREEKKENKMETATIIIIKEDQTEIGAIANKKRKKKKKLSKLEIKLIKL
jgi:hypothetical protein